MNDSYSACVFPEGTSKRVGWAPAMDSQSLLAQQTRASTFGQDSSRLYDRENGKKPWRAEYPALVEQKAVAKEFLNTFAEAWPLDSLRLQDNHLKHVAALHAALPAADSGRRSNLLGRIRRAEAARRRHVAQHAKHPGVSALVLAVPRARGHQAARQRG